MPGAGDGVPEAGGFRFGEVSRQVFDGVAGERMLISENSRRKDMVWGRGWRSRGRSGGCELWQAAAESSTENARELWRE
jgi:hypothetical protein